ncbi:purine-nucleoside phosphorylase [Corallincola holothuriorum]|uniref:Purine nucleoside phosphorylase DeoD-type n=1 Tax=Corallincola holothuriorum TaxID=2282215 RepID=A0A368N4S0_9GAMM|nr:purine-nucleoside phosphorylase [Corallincola holothuriorum]RCU45216.1 purine-nucleoside phosphorylase [Corallincola holothuriorum]
MATPHISAGSGAFADTVLLPGDPLRAKFIAEQYLEQAECINQVRGMLAYTGNYKGLRVSVMGSGMGIPSCSIYARELYTEYEVKQIIRVGSCGAIQGDIQLNDIILAMGACTDSGVNRARLAGHDFAAIADYGLLKRVADQALADQVPVRVGNVVSTDLFYAPSGELMDRADQMGVLAVEMEAAGLYGVAAEYGAKALTVLTVSDHIRRDEQLSSDARERSFHSMMKLTLDALLD